jgi:hypothetical protein
VDLFRGQPKSERPCSQSKPKFIVGGTGVQVSVGLSNLLGEPTKQNGGESRARGFKRSRCPGRLGLTERRSQAMNRHRLRFLAPKLDAPKNK